jgi:5'-3' exonuclease
MGIERFFSSIENNNITNLNNKFSNNASNTNKLKTNRLYIDYNSIIHVRSQKVLSELNKILQGLIKLKPDKIKSYVDYYKEYIDILTNNKLTYEEYLDVFIKDPDLIDTIIIAEVMKDTKDIISSYFDTNKLEILYITIDGVPNQTKMKEQKNRRYMGYFIHNFKKLIFEKHEEDLKKKKEKYIFLQNSLSWSKNNISPGTKFMDKMQTELISTEFEFELKQLCTNLKKYIFSGTNEYGEGEKKIVDEIKKTVDQTKNYTIYSPDSDVSLLGLLLHKNIQKLNILRHNQQKNTYEIILIDTLANNLHSYCKNKTKQNLIQDNIINDIVFILTTFGNDFLPKIESINIKYDFDKLIDIYLTIVKETNEYLLSKKINYKFLLLLLKKIKDIENQSLQKTYISSHYRNYEKLKKILQTSNDDFNETIIEFLENIRKFHKEIENNGSYNKLSKDFYNKLKQLTKIPNININKLSITEFIDIYKQHYNQKSKPKIFIGFSSMTKSIDNYYHQTKLNMIAQTTTLTDYDKEIYKLENMLDEYKLKLNSKNINIGKIFININTYQFETEEIDIGIRRYYKENFNLDINQLDKVNEEYCKGLLWVFDYYYNSYTSNYEQNSSLWFYPYDKSPLIQNLYEFLKNKPESYFTNLENIIQKSYISNEKYFNCIEHLLFVSPSKNLLNDNFIPKELHNFVKESKFFVDLDKYINKIWKSNKNTIINCVGVLFLNKCTLEIEEIADRDSLKYLESIRKIKLSNKTKILACDTDTQKNIFVYKPTTKMLEIKQRGGIIKRYKYYKKRYQHTKNLKYKKIYKRFRSLL